MAIEWVASVNRYRDTDTGRFVSPEQVEALVEKSRVDAAKRLTKLADRLNREEITPAQWEKEFRQIIKETSITQYATGRGGLSQMNPVDYGKVGSFLKDQYKYLKKFKDALPDQSEAQIRMRSQMYAASTKVMYDIGNGAGYGLPDLPAYPTESSPCMFNCACKWRITILKGKENWNCYWTLGTTEHCNVCDERAVKWNPLRIRKGVIQNA